MNPSQPLDAGIVGYVDVLRAAGVETFDSCEGGEGHSSPEPMVRFYGERCAGWHALGAAQASGLPVLAIRRTWPVNDGEPTGPYWEMVFRSKGRVDGSAQTSAMATQRMSAGT
jgi:hypothetical protein